MRLFISPCPNDTFAFYPLIHGLIDTEGITFRAEYCDIDQLNTVALSNQAPIIKISCALLPTISQNYTLLPAGAALGYGNGPLLVSRRKIYPDELPYATVAIPGLHTTANMLLDKVLPPVKEKHVYLFSDIASAVMDGEIDAGVLIHEGRFTYHERGLQLIADLGALWEEKTAMPIPLGCIVASNNLNDYEKQKVGRAISRSVSYAMTHPNEPMEFVRSHARELSESVLRNHIDFFVNDFTVDLTDRGYKAIKELTGYGLAR